MTSGNAHQSKWSQEYHASRSGQRGVSLDELMESFPVRGDGEQVTESDMASSRCAAGQEWLDRNRGCLSRMTDFMMGR
jgi:hypothetical protein